MSLKNFAQWNHLDNAAKIFPSTSNERNTKVFRFACELYESVEPTVLQTALNKTIKAFPVFQSILKRGLFWYYLEKSDIKPIVKPENKPPCSPIYERNVKRLLFEVTYFKKRINFEVYHALTDGTGALNFLRVLVFNYLIILHQDNFKNQIPFFNYDASITQKADDSFQKYYTKKFKLNRNKKRTSYKLKGIKISENRIRIIEGVVSLKSVLKQAHKYNTTLTVFLTAVFMCSVFTEMEERKKIKPVVIKVPVNLRKYFPSETARNFFCLMDVDYNFKDYSAKFDDVIRSITESFKRELNPERLGAKFNSYSSLERNVFVRVTPLFLKDIILKIASKYLSSETTTSLSNIGKVDMPKEVMKYIRLFDIFISTPKLQICICSFEDNLTISFTSSFVNTEIQKNFFRTLTGMGIDVELSANEIDNE